MKRESTANVYTIEASFVEAGKVAVDGLGQASSLDTTIDMRF